jgi:hypothetical protein
LRALPQGTMPTFLIEHRWEERRSEEAKSLVAKIVDMAASEKLPSGYQLLNVVLNKDDRCAECVWEAPGRSELEEFVDSMKPPTVHTLSGAQVVYGLERVPARIA